MKRLIATACAALIALMPCAAYADMQGVDISNWQCGIDTYNLQADFVIVGMSWGTGGFDNSCLANGRNLDGARQLQGSLDSGKKIGVYHYAMGGDPEAEADFFIETVKDYIGTAMLILDWEPQDNPAFGNLEWPRRWANQVKKRTGVNPVVYVMDSAYWQVQNMPERDDVGLWIAQYASNESTGYQEVPWNLGARNEVMRQYTSSGYVGGYAGRLDLNVFRGDAEAWSKYANPTGIYTGNTNTETVEPNTCATACVTVQSGDTVSAYWADWWNVTVPSGNPSLIYPGDVICHNESTASVTTAQNGYVVEPGDTLSSIAAAYGISWTMISGYSSGNPNLIYPGEVLYW